MNKEKNRLLVSLGTEIFSEKTRCSSFVCSREACLIKWAWSVAGLPASHEEIHKNQMNIRFPHIIDDHVAQTKPGRNLSCISVCVCFSIFSVRLKKAVSRDCDDMVRALSGDRKRALVNIRQLHLTSFGLSRVPLQAPNKQLPFSQTVSFSSTCAFPPNSFPPDQTLLREHPV